jgi:hypothetical protein
MPFVPYTQTSRTAARALEEFDESFRGALAVAEPEELWAAKHGFILSSDSLKTTFPIPLDAAGYKEFKGEAKYRSLYMRAISIFNDKTWQDGFEEFAAIVESNEFIGWGEQPGNMAKEWSRLPNELVAAVLEANPNLELYRDPDTGTLTSRALFADDHPCNILNSSIGTFDNNIGTTVAKIFNGQFFEEIKTYARSIKGPNGKPMRFRADGGMILCNGTREQLLAEALSQDTLIRAIKSDGTASPPAAPGATVAAAVTQHNRHKGSMGYTVCDELTSASDNVLYVILAGGPADNHPWAVLQESAPEVNILDKSSDKYVNTHKISYSAHGKCKAAALLPHRIVKVTIS